MQFFQLRKVSLQFFPVFFDTTGGGGGAHPFISRSSSPKKKKLEKKSYAAQQTRKPWSWDSKPAVKKGGEEGEKNTLDDFFFSFSYGICQGVRWKKRGGDRGGKSLGGGSSEQKYFSLFCLHSFYYFSLHACLGGGKKLKQKAVIATARAGERRRKEPWLIVFFPFILVGKKKLHLARARNCLLCVSAHLINFRTEAEADGSDKSPPDLLLWFFSLSKDFFLVGMRENRKWVPQKFIAAERSRKIAQCSSSSSFAANDASEVDAFDYFDNVIKAENCCCLSILERSRRHNETLIHGYLFAVSKFLL